jgi:[acyl-carrier-protein] S-malonyltransferase
VTVGHEAQDANPQASCAFIFPGQDAPRARMGLDFASHSALADALLDQATEITGIDVRRALEHGGPLLDRTSVLQPVITAVLLGVAGELLQQGVRPAFVAGHSLGELAAWSAAGAIAPGAAVVAAATRGRLMEREARLHPGGMLALTGITQEILQEALACGRARGRMDVAARNAIDVWVVTGEESALRAVAARFPATRLSASGPWHSPALADAVDALRVALTNILREPARAGFIANRTGRAVENEDDIPELLAGQLVRPVAWLETLDFLASAEVTDIVVVGPARPHAALARSRLGKRARVWTTETADEFSSAMEALRS